MESSLKRQELRRTFSSSTRHNNLNLEFTFKEKKGGTEVTMVQSRVPADQAEPYRQGWTNFYWKPMKEYFEKKA
jgi:activator of HSP90 ATPase